MWALFENDAGGLNWVAEMLDTGHAASFHAAAVHKQGVELDAAVGGEKATAAGIKGGVVFEDGDGCLNCVECRPATRKDSVACFKRVADAGLVGLGLAGRDGPCAAMDQERGGVDGVSRHRNIVEHFARSGEIVKLGDVFSVLKFVSISGDWLILDKWLNLRENSTFLNLQGIIEILVKLRTFNEE